MKMKTLYLGAACLLFGLLVGVVFPYLSIMSLAPYLAFCICSLLVQKGGLKTSAVIWILLIGLVALPLLDYFILFPPLASPLLTAFLPTLLRVFVYFLAFIIINCLIKRRRKALSSAAWVALIALLLLYTAIKGLNDYAAYEQFLRAYRQGSIFSWISALSNQNGIGYCITTAIFYLSLFHTSYQLTKSN